MGPLPPPLSHTGFVSDVGAQPPAVEEVLAALKEDELFWRCRQLLRQEAARSRHDVDRLPPVLAATFESSGAGIAVKNFALQRLRGCRQRALRQEAKEQPPDPAAVSGVAASAEGRTGVSPAPAEHLAWARRRFADLTTERLRELSKEQRQPLLRPRMPRPGGANTDAPPAGTGGGGLAFGGFGGQGAMGGGSFSHATEEEEVTTSYIIDLNDLYQVLFLDLREHMAASPKAAALKSTVEEPAASEPSPAEARPEALPWGQLGIRLHASTLEELSARFRDLEPAGAHLGVPEVLPVWGPGGAGSSSACSQTLRERRYQEGQDLLERPYVLHLQLFARYGLPPGLRREVWTRCLVGGGLEQKAEALTDLARGVGIWEWLTDDVLRLDVAEHCANDTCYFPFDEIVEAMVLAWSRDDHICEDCEAGPPQLPLLAAGVQPPSEEGSAGQYHEDRQRAPPCGVVPFKTFSNYACPIAFLSDRLEVAYPIFRAVYCRYLSKLHAISEEPGTLLPLCALFESLVFSVAPQLINHLVQLGPESAPLRLALPWIVSGFAGFLRADQVLWLWDRIVGFDSTELIAVLAAAIFTFRTRLVLNARSAEDAVMVFSDISSLQAVPLLQQLLFADELGGHFAL